MPDTTIAPPGPLVNGPNDHADWRTCPHPGDRIEWRRDPLMYRWVGICRGCGVGRTFPAVMPPIVRTDEQLAKGDVPPIPLVDRYIAETCPSLNYEPW